MALWCAIFLPLLGCTERQPPVAVDFTIDLKHVAYQRLNMVGEYKRINGVIIVALEDNQFVAFQSQCPYPSGGLVTYQKTSRTLGCANNTSIFDLSGKVLMGPATNNLLPLATALDAGEDKDKVAFKRLRIYRP